MAKKKRKKQKGSVTSNSTSGIEIPLKEIESSGSNWYLYTNVRIGEMQALFTILFVNAA